MPYFELETEGHVAHLRLNAPEKLNAMGPEFWTGLAPQMAAIDADFDVRAVVLSGAGRAFSAGLDLVGMMPLLPLDQGGPPDGARRQKLHQLIRDMQAAVTAVERCRVPVIAAVHGYCLGGGIDLITACDVRLAAQNAVFGVRETKLAMVADIGTLQRLPQLVGQGIARELVFTGRDFDADYAAQIGLVNRVLPTPQACLEAALSLAQEIAANAPLAVQGAKRVLNEQTRAEVDRGLEYVATWNAAHLATQDLGVAVTAHISKQTPEYSGR